MEKKKLEFISGLIPVGGDVNTMRDEIIKLYGESVEVVAMSTCAVMMQPSLQFPQGQPGVVYTFILKVEQGMTVVKD